MQGRFLPGSALWELWYFVVCCHSWEGGGLPSKKRIKFRKKGLTKGGVSGNIHGRLERGGRRERLRAKGKKFRKKFLTKRAGCGSIEKLRLRAKGLEREQRVPCKLNNVNQETPWTKEKECFERRAKKQPTEKILELEARSE